MLLLRPALFAICHDEEYARVSGLPVRTLNLLIAVTTAVTVTIAMRTVGLLLVSALMVVPVATAQQVTRGFRGTMALAMALGFVAAGAGVALAGEINTAPGATIVVLAIAGFAVVAIGLAVTRLVRRRSVAADPAGRGGRAARTCVLRPLIASAYALTALRATVTDAEPATRSYEGAGELLRALAAPIRLAIVTELGAGERCVHELVDKLGAPQPLVSQHLRVLRGAGVVRGARRGREIAYTLVDEHVAHIVADAVSHAREAR